MSIITNGGIAVKMKKEDILKIEVTNDDGEKVLITFDEMRDYINNKLDELKELKKKNHDMEWHIKNVLEAITETKRCDALFSMKNYYLTHISNKGNKESEKHES